MKTLSPEEVDGLKAAALHAQEELRELWDYFNGKKLFADKINLKEKYPSMKERLNQASCPPQFIGNEPWGTKMRGALSIRNAILQSAINAFKNGGHDLALVDLDRELCAEVISALSIDY